MKRILICLLSLLPGIPFYVSAQNSFLKMAPGLSATAFLEWKDGNYLLCGADTTVKDNLQNFRLRFTTIDSAGNVIYTQKMFIDTFGNDTFFSVKTPVNSIPYCIFNNHLVGGAIFAQKDGNYTSLLMQLNDSFSKCVRTVKVVPGTGVAFIRRLLVTSNNELIVFGDYQNTKTNIISSFLSAYDSTLQLKWQRNFSITYGSALADHIIAIPGGFVIALEYQFNFSGGEPTAYTGDIQFLNATGNKMISIPIINKKSVNSLKLAEVNNGDYLVSWNDDYMDDPDNPNIKGIPNEHATLWIAKFNKSGIYWQRNLQDYISSNVGEFETSEFSNTDMIKTSDGNFVISGYFVSYPFFYLPFAVKIDDAARVKWFKSYNFFNKDHDSLPVYDQTFISIVETKDKGLIVAGNYAKPYSSSFPNGIQTALAIKLAEDGCVENYCGLYTGINPFAAQKKQLNSIKIYPNPAQNYICIADLPQAGQKEIMQYSIYDMSGKCLLKDYLQDDKTILVSALPAGSYLLKISGKRNIYEATFQK